MDLCTCDVLKYFKKYLNPCLVLNAFDLFISLVSLYSCVGNSYPIRDGSIRLVGDSRHPYTGRLEIMYHGLWMSVCGKLFQQETANVVCRQLGYTHVESYCTDAW